MPQDLRRFHHSAQSHFLTFSCYRRQPKFDTPDSFDLFVVTLEEMRRRFLMRTSTLRQNLWKYPTAESTANSTTTHIIQYPAGASAG